MIARSSHDFFVLLVSLCCVVEARAVDPPVAQGPCGQTELDPAVGIGLVWSAVPGADSYNWQLSMDPSFNWVDFDLTAVANTVQVSTLYYSATYFWRVRTNDGGVFSTWSATCMFSTMNMPAPPAPFLLSPANGAAGLGTSVTLQWGFIPATDLQVQVSTDALFTNPIILFTQGQFTTVNGLANGQTYHWRVQGTNIGGTGPWSEVWTFTVGQPSTSITLRLLLQGPLHTGTLIMGDGLRAAGLVPTTEPYSGAGWTQLANTGATVGAGVLATTGNNAVVDWVVLEARHATNNAVLSRWALLVQRDGDVMMPSGAALGVVLPAPQVKLAVRHRNHLGALCSTVFNSNTSITADFTLLATPLHGTDATTTVGGVRALWCGDVTGNGLLQYTGAGNDRDPVLVAIGGTMPTATLGGQYRPEDVNMDALVKYTGANNDRDPILSNVGGATPTATRAAQLP